MEKKAAQVMPGNRPENGMAVLHEDEDGKKFEALMWEEHGPGCKGCGAIPACRTILKRELVEAQGSEEQQEAFIAGERARFQELIAGMGDTCPDCLGKAVPAYG